MEVPSARRVALCPRRGSMGLPKRHTVLGLTNRSAYGTLRSGPGGCEGTCRRLLCASCSSSLRFAITCCVYFELGVMSAMRSPTPLKRERSDAGAAEADAFQAAPSPSSCACWDAERTSGWLGCRSSSVTRRKSPSGTDVSSACSNSIRSWRRVGGSSRSRASRAFRSTPWRTSAPSPPSPLEASSVNTRAPRSSTLLESTPAPPERSAARIRAAVCTSSAWSADSVPLAPTSASSSSPASFSAAAASSSRNTDHRAGTAGKRSAGRGTAALTFATPPSPPLRKRMSAAPPNASSPAAPSTPSSSSTRLARSRVPCSSARRASASRACDMRRRYRCNSCVCGDGLGSWGNVLCCCSSALPAKRADAHGSCSALSCSRSPSAPTTSSILSTNSTSRSSASSPANWSASIQYGEHCCCRISRNAEHCWCKEGIARSSLACAAAPAAGTHESRNVCRSSLQARAYANRLMCVAHRNGTCSGRTTPFACARRMSSAQPQPGDTEPSPGSPLSRIRHR
mmetsp:Transcript_4018/g.12869  ORF Transcript_4018/g.12869 Transcript_4018/m.12869 type:complete len:513 (-) Transcript_4018:392-1930(-)